VAISNNSGTLTLSGNTTTIAAATNTLRLTIDNTQSAAFTLTVSPAALAPAPNLTINCLLERFEGLDAAKRYVLFIGSAAAGQNNFTNAYSAGMTFLNIAADWMGATLSFAEYDGSVVTSLWRVLAVPARPAAPGGVAGGSGALTGVTASMEYAASASGPWTTCTASPMTVPAGTYYVRMKATASAFAGVPTGALTVTATPTYSISASSLTSFGSLQTPYTQPAAQTVTITNTGSGSVTLTQPTAANYDIGALSKTALATNGETATFTVRPKAGLPVGTYNETITVTGTNSANATVSASFSVTADPFVAVTDITGVPTSTKATTPLSLTGTVVPANASNQTIAWTVKSAGNTGATIAAGSNVLNTVADGTAVVTATIANGAAAGTAFTKDFTITVDKITSSGELPQANPLKAWVNSSGLLHIEGLTAGATLSIYTAAGALVYNGIAASTEADIPLASQGVYIVKSGDNTLKVSYN
jgi:hypothetical protein